MTRTAGYCVLILVVAQSSYVLSRAQQPHRRPQSHGLLSVCGVSQILPPFGLLNICEPQPDGPPPRHSMFPPRREQPTEGSPTERYMQLNTLNRFPVNPFHRQKSIPAPNDTPSTDKGDPNETPAKHLFSTVNDIWETILDIFTPETSIRMGETSKLTEVRDDDSCVYNGQPGICLNLRNCPSLLSTLVNAPRPLPQSVREGLLRAQCGFEGTQPKVCCPPTRSTNDVTTSPTTTPARAYAEPPPDISHNPNLRLLPSEACGSLDDDRIIGGNKTQLFEFPWMALIAYNTKRGVGFRCGGTLISERYVLTAAHCVSHLDGQLTLAGVRLGEHDTRTDEDCGRDEAGERICSPPVQDFTIEEAIPHPDYSPLRLQHDVGLIRLSAPADLTKDNVQPVCLPITRALQSVHLEDINVLVAGWGATELGTASPDLLKVSLPVVSNLECGRIHNKSVSSGIGYRQMCAGGLNGKDSCGGDSGGPLMYPTQVSEVLRYVQQGIVSFGPKRCGTNGFPGVYTRVAYYMDWILSHMRP